MTTMSPQDRDPREATYDESDSNGEVRPPANLAARPDPAPMVRPEPRDAPVMRIAPQTPAARAMTSEDTDALFGAMVRAQSDFGDLKKTRKADVKNRAGAFLYSYSYANLADVTAAVMPSLKANGLMAIQIPLVNKIVVRLIHGPSGQWIEGALPFVAPGQGPDGIQAMGSAITYMRRYLLTMILGIVADDAEDDDGANAQQGGRAA